MVRPVVSTHSTSYLFLFFRARGCNVGAGFGASSRLLDVGFFVGAPLALSDPDPARELDAPAALLPAVLLPAFAAAFDGVVRPFEVLVLPPPLPPEPPDPAAALP